MCWQCGAWDKLKVERHSVFEFLFYTEKRMTNNFKVIVDWIDRSRYYKVTQLDEILQRNK